MKVLQGSCRNLDESSDWIDQAVNAELVVERDGDGLLAVGVFIIIIGVNNRAGDDEGVLCEV